MASHLQGENDDSNSIEDDDDDNNNNNNPFEYLNQKTQQKFNQNKNVDLLFNKNYKNNLQNSLVRFDRRRDNTAAVDQSKFQQQRNTNYEKTFLNFPSTPKIIGQRFSNENNEIHENQQQQQQQLSNRIRKIRRAIYYYYDTNYYDNQKDDIVKLKLKRIAAAAASTSINGFNNLISRNNVKEKLQDEASIQSNKTKKKNLDDKFAANQPDDQQRRHNHRIRSILDASSVRNSIHQQTIRQHHLQQHHLQQQHQLGRVAATEHQPRIASIRLTDRLPWFEPIAATTIFSIALIGIVIVAIVFLVWLKTLLFQSSETTQPERLVNTDLAKTAPIRMERKKVRKDFRSVGSRRNNNADNEVPTSLRNIVLNALSFDNTKQADSDSENISIDEQQQQPSINNTSTRVQSPLGIDGGPSLPPSPLASHIGESLSIPRPPTPIPLAIVCAQIPIGGGGGARNSPKLSTVHDKENESPISGELLANSPKKKLNENILAEQNSPRIIETAAAATRFSFSPKQLNKHRRPATPTSTAQQNTINSSPLLSSAVYKHGNYFKFPEVDCLTPDKLINSCPAQTQPTSIQTGPIPAAAAGKLTVVGNQAARRARLKSISLDSEGARLVEDNLGIPVEELMEIANQSPPEFNSSDESCFREETVVQTQRKQNDKKIAASTPPSTNKLNRTKNKNNLTINIETEEPHSINNNNNAISTPKTPTLNQTKQKAVSLDSSDSSSTTATTILYGCRQSSSTVVHHHHHPYYQGQQRLATSTTTTTTTTKSLLHVSSTSMPTTPQRNRPTRKKLLTKTVQKSPTTIDKSIEIVGDDETTDDEDVGGGDDNDDGGGIVFEEDEELSDEPIERPQPTNNLLGTNLQNQKCNALSLSNNNLKTLPEVMTLSDFSTPASTAVAQPDEAKPKMTAARSNILQRRGSNHSLTLNLNSSFGNLTKGLSVSNYSLGSFNGSNYNLNHHLSHNQQIINQPSTNSSTQSIAARGCSSSQGNILLSRSSQPTNPVAEAGALTKKNLLQRRGSNTSLTLNIKGSSDANLSRFNSHSSLNIAASTQHHHHHHHHHHQNNQLHQSLSQNKLKQQLQHQHGPGLGSKRGLLERRNSNASLTLNVQGLSISNCNLRGSACSLSSILNPDFKNSDPTINTEIDIGGSTNARRKFLSSENLNSVPQCTKLNQTHVRNSTKTCFGSVSDLKPANELTGGGVNHPSDSVRTDEFEQTALCSCTGVRNITTKPLSPQSTSEDFKMYLANIQLLQNATNCLSDEHLRKLHFVFQRSYQMKPPPIADCELQYGRKTIPPPPSVQHFSFNVSPTDDEQKHLVRTLHEEFWDLPTNHQEKPLVFGSQTKNRYKTILPNEHSRVILDQEIGSLLEVYINANYIKGPEYTQNSYIATQGPLPNTIYDFWLMVDQNIAKLEKQQQQQQQRQHHQLFEIKFDQAGELKVRNSKYRSTKKPQQTPPSRRNSATVNNKCQKIIMLTNFIENNQQKCSFYFPIDENQTIFVTARDERYENDGLARFYAKYLNWKNGVDTQEFEVEFEIGDGDHDGGRSDDGDSPLRKSQIPSSNYFVLKNAGLVSKDGFTIRKIVGLHVSTGRNDSRGCVQQLRRFVAYHYWFPDWPDHRSPADINVLLDMSLHLLDSPCRGEFMKFDPIPHDCDSIFEAIIRRPDTDAEPLPIIHCSAGIGRTGCLAAILNGIRQIRASIRAVLKPWNYELTARALEEIKTRKNYVAVDVLGIVCNLRLQRGGMVQNSEQYELIHRALCLYQARIDEELTAWDRKIIVQGMDDQSESNDEDDEVDQTTIL